MGYVYRRADRGHPVLHLGHFQSKGRGPRHLAAGHAARGYTDTEAQAEEPPRSATPAIAAARADAVRLEIRLGGPDNCEVVKGMAREARLGRAWREEEGEEGEEEKEDVKEKEAKEKKDADGDVEMDADGVGIFFSHVVHSGPAKSFDRNPSRQKKNPKKKSKAAAEYYDTNDPFIDDSELAIDERTYFAQVKQKGFYVSNGEVALARGKSPKNPKSKRKVGPALSLNLPIASTSALKPLSTAAAMGRKAMSLGGEGSKSAPASKVGADKTLGTKDSLTPLEDDDDEKGDVFGPGVTQDAGVPRASGKCKEKAEEGDEAAIAEGVNRMKGKWKERVSVNSTSPSANGESVNGECEGGRGGRGRGGQEAEARGGAEWCRGRWHTEEEDGDKPCK
ncbi:hypothetical protein K438DRAFT_2092020 [Mycena galopus ATCC 62051]|nr:hypothetical protein K438DRAFT_2092020 [Mycena galopus ATCC 62051]